MPEYDVALELARLHIMKGADFIRQLKQLVSLSIFKPVENEKDIYAAEGCHRDDFPMLVDAARKAVAHGNIVYILPNPQGIRTADFIFVNKGVYKMYDFSRPKQLLTAQRLLTLRTSLLHIMLVSWQKILVPTSTSILMHSRFLYTKAQKVFK